MGKLILAAGLIIGGLFVGRLLGWLLLQLGYLFFSSLERIAAHFS